MPQIDPDAKRRIVANVCHTRSIIEPGNDIFTGRNGLSIIFQRTIIYCPRISPLDRIKVAPHTRCSRVEVINPACGMYRTCRNHCTLFLAIITVQRWDFIFFGLIYQVALQKQKKLKSDHPLNTIVRDTSAQIPKHHRIIKK